MLAFGASRLSCHFSVSAADDSSDHPTVVRSLRGVVAASGAEDGGTLKRNCAHAADARHLYPPSQHPQIVNSHAVMSPRKTSKIIKSAKVRPGVTAATNGTSAERK